MSENVTIEKKIDDPDGWEDVSLPDWVAGLDHPKKSLTPFYLAASEYYELAEVENQIAGLEAIIDARGDRDGSSLLGDEDEALEQLAELRERRSELREVVRDSETPVRIQNPYTPGELAALLSEHTTSDGNLDDIDALIMTMVRRCQVEPNLSRAGWEKLRAGVGAGQWMQFFNEMLDFVRAEAVRPDFSHGASLSNPD